MNNKQKRYLCNFCEDNEKLVIEDVFNGKVVKRQIEECPICCYHG